MCVCFNVILFHSFSLAYLLAHSLAIYPVCFQLSVCFGSIGLSSVELSCEQRNICSQYLRNVRPFIHSFEMSVPAFEMSVCLLARSLEFSENALNWRFVKLSGKLNLLALFYSQTHTHTHKLMASAMSLSIRTVLAGYS